MTSERSTSFMALAEYLLDVAANTVQRPKFIIGAVTAAAIAPFNRYLRAECGHLSGMVTSRYLKL
jgi:hypothetical protein